MIVFLIFAAVFAGLGSESGSGTSAVGDRRVFATLLAAGIALVAVVATFYAHYRTGKLAEVTAWKECHDRIGKLYDMAITDEEIYAVLAESPDYEGEHLHPQALSRKQTQWMTNYLMALEQSTLCLEIMNHDSRAAWEKHIDQHLSTPSFRAVFFEDNAVYHARQTADGDPNQSGGWSLAFTRLAIRALPASLFDRLAAHDGPLAKRRPGHELWQALYDEVSFTPRPATGHVAAPAPGLDVVHLDPDDRGQAARYADRLREIFADAEVEKQVYPQSLDWPSLAAAHRYLLVRDGDVVASFTLEMGDGRLGEVGFVVAPWARREGLAGAALRAAKDAARALGLVALRANVYEDNLGSIRALERADFRRFVWYELNL